MIRTFVARTTFTRTIPGFLMLVLLGLMNTVFLKPEDIGFWREPVGVVLLVLAFIYSFVFVFSWPRKEAIKKSP